MKKSFFTLFLLVWGLSIFAQNKVVSEKYVISYRFLGTNSNYKKVFKLLSVNNEKNINSIKLEVSYFLQATSQKGTLNIETAPQTITGNINFRDFNFDSLLMPDRIKVIYWPLQAKESDPPTILTFPFPSKFKIPNVSDIQDIRFEFDISPAKLSRFIIMAEVVNHYYGYLTILQNLKKGLLSNNESDASVLSDYDILHRIIWNIQTTEIIQALNLKLSDPRNFLLFYNKAKRLERRKHTLSLQYINKDLRYPEDKSNYIKSLTGISIKFLTEKNNYQPYIAHSFEQIAIMVNDNEMRNFYRTVCNHIDLHVIEHPTATQAVLNAFLEKVELYNDREAYAYALLMLQNALTWSNIFNLQNTNLLLPYINKTIDGLLAAYTSIAVSALKKDNYFMAEKYLDEARKYYTENKKDFPGAQDSTFLQFQTQLIDYIKTEVKKHHDEHALDILFSFKQLSFSNNNRPKVEELKKEAYQNLFHQRFNSLSLAFSTGHIQEAYNRLNKLQTFYRLNQDYITLDRSLKQKIDKIAYGLLLEFLQNGEILWDRNNYNEAMKNYGWAEDIQNNYLDYKVDRLDELINQTAVPVVLEKINQADLKIWANDISAAKELHSEIYQTIEKYNLLEVDTVNKRYNELYLKLKNRNCSLANNEIQNNLTVIRNRIKSKKWQEAYERFEKTEKLLQQNKNCSLDSSGFIKLKTDYQKAFDYLKDFKTIENRLILSGYNNIWKDYADLLVRYNRQNLRQAGLPDPGLYDLLKAQKNEKNIKQITAYYLSNDHLTEALMFLSLLHDMHINDKETKNLLKETGTKMAQHPELIPLFKKISAQNDKWFKPLINAYLYTLQ